MCYVLEAKRKPTRPNEEVKRVKRMRRRKRRRMAEMKMKKSRDAFQQLEVIDYSCACFGIEQNIGRV